MPWNAFLFFVGTRGRCRRRMCRTPPSTLGRGVKAARGDAFTELELEPGCPLGGHHGGGAHPGASSGDLPLHEQDGVGPGGGVQQPPQNRRGDVEGDVAHDDMGVRGQVVAQEVVVDDRDGARGREVTPQRLSQPGIDLHGGEGSSRVGERVGEGAVARTDFNDGAGGVGDPSEEGVDDAGVGEEVLAVLVTAV